MPLTTGNFPPVEPATFLQMPYRERLKALSRHWAEYGFGAPKMIMFIYLFRMILFTVGCGILAATLTSDLNPFKPAEWFDQAIVRGTDSPWTRMSPLSGNISPIRCDSSTDLPVPDGPRMTVIMPFPVRDALQDALLVVLLETGFPIWAVDADRTAGELGLRRSLPGELRGPSVRPGQATPPPPAVPEPVVTDARGVVAELGREPRAPHRATYRTRRTTFFCARVPGLPALRVEEAIWLCRSLVDQAR